MLAPVKPPSSYFWGSADQLLGYLEDQQEERLTRAVMDAEDAQDIIDRVKVQELRNSLEKVLFEKFHERAQ